jgi:hypothetical protein
MNWFLFVVGTPFIFEDTVMHPGQSSVGQCEKEPGIKDMKHGTLYVAPERYIVEYHIKNKQTSLSYPLVRKAILDYYGIE